MLRNTLRQQLASSSRLAVPHTASTRTTRASSSSQRQLHTSPALDPKDDAAAATLGATPPSDIQAAAPLSRSDFVKSKTRSGGQEGLPELIHVPLRHLHKSTAYYTREEGKRLPKGALQYVPLSSHVFGISPRRDILHSAVVYYLDSLRSGTASTKTRGEVNYSTRKLMQQKGSGKARVGSAGSPTRRGGGVAHGPKPRDFATELPRRVRELALRSALSAKWQEGHLHVVTSLYWDPPPRTTGNLFRTLSGRKWKNSLFLTAPRNPTPAEKKGILQRPGRPSALDPVYSDAQREEHTQFLKNFKAALGNIPNTNVIRLDTLTAEHQAAATTPEEKKKPGELPAYEILHKEQLILDLGAVEWLEEKLGGAIFHTEDGREMSSDEVVEMLKENEEEILEAQEQQQEQEQQMEAEAAKATSQSSASS
ncbi:unnamed protein product [Sympodiomycopsis kandeliae]